VLPKGSGEMLLDFDVSLSIYFISAACFDFDMPVDSRSLESFLVFEPTPPVFFLLSSA